MFNYVSLEHVVVLLFGAEALLQNGYVPLVVLVLFFQRFHLGPHRQQFLVPFANFHSELFDLFQ